MHSFKAEKLKWDSENKLRDKLKVHSMRLVQDELSNPIDIIFSSRVVRTSLQDWDTHVLRPITFSIGGLLVYEEA